MGPPDLPDEPYLLAVDGGQTSTRALVARMDGRILGQGSGGPIDHFHSERGRENNRAAIQAAICSACVSAQIGVGGVVTVALGLTGVQLDAPQTPLVESIVREIMSPQHIVVVPDYVANLVGASGGTPGIVVIAGGGAIAYGVTQDGREALAGGFGYLLGDEGSGFDIGRRAAVAAIRASDGRDQPTILERMVKDAFGLTDMRQMIGLVYDASFHRERLAHLAPLAARAATAGDAAASGIMLSAGQELARTALAVVHKLHAREQEVAIYLTGGVFDAGDVVREPFRKAVMQGCATAELRAPADSPVVGALIIAYRHTSAEAGSRAAPDASWLSAARHSLAHLQEVT